MPFLPSPEHWLVDYEHTEQVVRRVTETVTQRRQAPVGTVQHALLSNTLRTSIPQAEKQVEALIQRLDDWELRQLTEAERERRTRLCERLQSAVRRADMEVNQRRPQGDDVGAMGWGVVEEDEDLAEGLSTDQLRQNQQRLLREQDAGLENLSQIVTQQRRIATTIGTEVDDQNVLIDDIGERTDNARNRLVDETDHISTVTRKSRTWPFWLVICLLMVAIVIILLW